MVKKFVSILFTTLFLLSQPINVLADMDLWNGYANPLPGGSGFYLDSSRLDNHEKPLYRMRGSQGEILLTNEAIWITQYGEHLNPIKGEDNVINEIQGVHLKISFPGANPDVRVSSEQQMDGHVSYLLGTDSKDWIKDMQLWGLIRYHELYPGIDLVVRSTINGFVWELEAQPGVDAAHIYFLVRGADKIEVAVRNYVLETGIGEVRLPLLGLEGGVVDTSIQGKSGTQFEPGVFVIVPTPGVVEINDLNPADKLTYSTYLGGSQLDEAVDVAIDTSGYAYLVGTTPSPDFPVTPGSFDETFVQMDGFAAKIDPNQSTLIYATYIGGDGSEKSSSVAVDNGIAYIAGETDSPNFPIAGAANQQDAYVVALNAAGNSLNYAKLIGGSDDERGYAIDAENGTAYVTGITFSSDFPVTDSSDYKNNGDIFLVKLNNAGITAYSSLLGGSSIEAGYGLAVINGTAWITGETSSNNIATGFHGGTDVFVANYTPAGVRDTLRLFGGNLDDRGFDLAMDTAGDVYITGFTNSTNFPVTEGTYGGSYDAFFLKVNRTSTLYSTYLGGSNVDQGLGIAIDEYGGTVVTGLTQSENFPTTSDAFQITFMGEADAFITRYFLAGADPGHRNYSTYLGGANIDRAYSVEMDSSVFAYVVGETKSGDFPVTEGALFREMNGAQDGFFSVLTVGPIPVVEIKKYTNGEDANVPPGPYLAVGSAISWRYDVMNTGDVKLTNVSVIDNQGVTVTCPKTTLDIGETMQCNASGSAITGQYSNLGTVIATTPYHTTVGDVDSSHYFGAVPQNNLVKKTNGDDANVFPGVFIENGSNVLWTYEVANTGNVDLTNVVVVDDNGTPANTADDVIICTIPVLGAGVTDTTSCALSGLAQSGQYTNIAVVTGTAPGALGNVSDDDPSNYFGSAPDINMVKKINGVHVEAPGPYLLVGGPIIWTYELQNTGNVTLTNISVLDDRGTISTLDDQIICSEISLPSGDSTTCTWNDTAVAGQYHNTATVTATPPVGANVLSQDDSYYFGAQPDVQLEYSVNGDPADSSPGIFVLSGSSLALVYQVTNAGNVPLSTIVVTDDTYPVCTISSLAVGESQTCSRSITAVSGQQSSTASVIASPPAPIGNVTASDPIFYFGADPAMSLVKKTNGQDAETVPGVYILAGDSVGWTYSVTNTGNVPLNNITVVDDHGTPLDPMDDENPIGCVNFVLNPGETNNCSLSGLATVGQYTNIAVATATPPAPLQTITTSDVSHYFGATLNVIIAKQTNGEDAQDEPGPLLPVGAEVNWGYLVSNQSNVSVDISVKDDNGTPSDATDDITFCNHTLPPSTNQSCALAGVAIPGQYTNVAVVTVTPPQGLEQFTAQDVSHYFGVITGVNIVKYTNGQDANDAPGPFIRLGEAVNWTYVVTNSGNVILESIGVTDDQGVSVTCPQTTLNPTASMTCSASGIAIEGQYANIGTVSAQPPAGFAIVTDSDPSHYFGSTANVDMQKLTNGVDAFAPPGPYIRVGEQVTWTYIVTNTGNMTLETIVVTDNKPGVVVNCPPVSELLPTESITCTATGQAILGQYTNIGQVSAVVQELGGVVYDEDASYYFGANPAIQVIKKTNGEDANEPPGPYIPVGEIVQFSYEVTNVGDMDLTEVVVSNEGGLIPDCTQEELLIGQVLTCQTDDTALIGQQMTSGSASALAPLDLGVVTDSDLSHYYGYSLGLDLVKYTNGIHVTEPPGPYLMIGDHVIWTYTVTNQSNVQLTNVNVMDSTGIPVACQQTSLDVSETIECTANGTVIAGQYMNVGTVSGYFMSENVQTEDVSYYYGLPAINIYLPLLMR